jgi:hypothetical protein
MADKPKPNLVEPLRRNCCETYKSITRINLDNTNLGRASMKEIQNVWC